MPRRTIRVVNRLGTIPASRVCTFCDRLFTVPLESLKKAEDPQWSMDPQFTEHKCKREDVSQAAAKLHMRPGQLLINRDYTH